MPMCNIQPTPITVPDARHPTSPPLTVGLVSPGWPPEDFSNGVVTSVTTLSDELRRAGNRVLILAKEVRRAHDDPDIIDVSRSMPRRSVARRGFDGVMYRLIREHWAARRFCRALGATTRHLVSDRGLQVLEMEEAFGWPSLVRREVSIPIVVRLHGPWFLNGRLQRVAEDSRFRWRVRAEREGIRSADFVTAPSKSVLELTRKFYGLPLENARVIPNLGPSIPASRRWRRDRSDPDLILFVGRFDWHKGGDVIVDAFAEVARKEPAVRLCFVGPDPGLVGPDGLRRQFGDYLEGRMPDAIRSGRVRWLGQQPPSAINELRTRAGVTVCCSRYETFGFSLIEAMAHGCPVVATEVGAIPEMIRDGENGLLCREVDPIGVAEKILRLRADGDLAELLGRQAGLDCESRHSPGELARQMADVYRILSGRRVNAPA